MGAEEMTLNQLAASVRRDAARLTRLDLTDAMRSCALAAKASILDNFQGQHDPDGVPWAPLKRERSRKRDRRAGGLAQILLDSGLLRASYQGGASHVEEIRPDGMTVGSNLDRAAWHQEGTRTIPARPQAGWNDALVERCQEIIADHMAQALGA